MTGIYKGLVVSNRQAASDMYIMEFIAPDMARECKPGQFLQVRSGATNDPLLRRPFSIYDVAAASGTISLLYRMVGKGTGLLAAVKEQAYVDVMGPLGRGFTLPDKPENIVMVGGGVGVAPLLYLGRTLRERHCQVRLLYGAENAAQLVAESQFAELGIPVLTATMDGSVGQKGLATDLLVGLDNSGPIDKIYACGPEAMMEVAANWGKARKIWGEVSLEEHMACGVGACLGCARQLQTLAKGYVKVCLDGPVFNIDEVELYKHFD